MSRIKTILQQNRVNQAVIDDFAEKAVKIVGSENISSGEVDLLSTCRDYWPVSSIWMLEGAVPALPQLVIWPQTTEEVSRVLALANQGNIPVVPYGEGSGALGGAVPLHGGVMLDLKKMNRVCKLDELNQMVTVECGMNGALYEEYLNRRGYTGGHFPQSLRCSTVGGWLACRAAGQFSTRYGKIEDIVVSLEAVLADGTVYSGRSVPRASTGPRTDLLMVGSEGVLGVITAANLRIWPLPEKRQYASYTFDNLADGLESIRKFIRAGTRPAVVRLYDAQETGNHFPELGDKRPGLILLFEGAETLVRAETELVDQVVSGQGAVDAGSEYVEHWLGTRFNVSAASRLLQKEAVLDTIEVTTNWHNAHSTYLAMQKALLQVEGTMMASGHWSHVYPEGAALYMTVVGFPGDNKVDYYKKIWQVAMEACLAEGAAISHHHGIGLHRGAWMEQEHGHGLELLKKVKAALDPKGIMNPGKLGLEEVQQWEK